MCFQRMPLSGYYYVHTSTPARLENRRLASLYFSYVHASTCMYALVCKAQLLQVNVCDCAMHTYSPSQWSINCPAEEDTQYYRSSSWTQDKWNDTIIDSSFHCPPNSYISGLRISEFDLLGGVCTDLGSFSMDEENCRDLSLFTYRVGTVNLDREEIITSVNMIPILR